MSTQTPTPAEAEAIHLAADEAEHALAAAESNVDATAYRLAAAGRTEFTEFELDAILYTLRNLRMARDAAVAASDAIRPHSCWLPADQLHVIAARAHQHPLPGRRTSEPPRGSKKPARNESPHFHTLA